LAPHDSDPVSPGKPCAAFAAMEMLALMPKNAIEVRNLVKTYAGTRRTAPIQALKGVDLDIPTGSIFGLLGPNGAGKSTFINILAGLVVKTSGTVGIWGFDQDENPRHARAAIGVVPQELNIDPFFTPLESLEVQAGLYAVPKSERRSMEILTRLGLAEHAHAYTRSLSGGMRRRLLVAKALVHNPPVLVLDEPTAGVDIELRRMLWDYVRELNTAGTTVILTTHYLEEAEAMCDRIAILNHGEVVACEDTPDLLARIDTKTLLLRLAERHNAPPDLGPEVTARMRAPDLLALTYSRHRASAPALVAAAQAAGLEITDITTEEAKLEEVFLSLTQSAKTD
jgi:ABC-2 type transport system ATP-binding protein